MRGLCWCVCVVVVVLMVQCGAVVAASSPITRRRLALRQVAPDCSAPSCCGRTEASAGCRFQGNKCRCPFIVPTPLVYLDDQLYRRRPPIHHHYYPRPGPQQRRKQRKGDNGSLGHDSNPPPRRPQYDQEGKRRTQGEDKDTHSSLEPRDLEKRPSQQED